MSEPTKEQIEKAEEWMKWANSQTLRWEDVKTRLVDLLAAETAPLHEKIASLEKQLAMFDPAAIAAYGDKREAEGRALAPPAQTQQGLSEVSLNDQVWAKVTAYGARYFADHWLGMGLVHSIDPGWQRFHLWEIASVFGGTLHNGCRLPFETTALRLTPPDAPSNLEKQTSPAAAPAQLSEVREALAYLRCIRCGYDLGNPTWNQFSELAKCVCAPARAALAGQPAPAAPTEDREALRAAALEEAAQIALMHGDGLDGEELAEAIRDLAGSPAQRARPSGEMNEHEDLDLLLVRYPGNTHRTLECLCGSDGFTIALSDNGQWNLECASCGENAAILTEVLAKLR